MVRGLVATERKQYANLIIHSAPKHYSQDWLETELKIQQDATTNAMVVVAKKVPINRGMCSTG